MEMIDQLEILKAENASLRKQVLQERIGRLSMEHSGAQATMALISMRSPQLEADLQATMAELEKLNKEHGN